MYKLTDQDIVIQDDQGEDYTVKNISDFYRHLLEFHGTGVSLHEENGHYFTVDDGFREFIREFAGKVSGRGG